MPGGGRPPAADAAAPEPPPRRRGSYSLTDSSEAEPEEQRPDGAPRRTPLQKLSADMCHDENAVKDLIIGRRVGFYKVRGEIGCGTFSRVKLAFHALTKDKVALKVLDKTRLDSRAQRLLYREVRSMEVLLHPNLLRLYEVVESPRRLYLVLEYAGGGDLHQRLAAQGRLPDHTCKVTFAQILAAIKHMHNINVIHRDLKAENVLFSGSGCVKVADFGFSTQVPHGAAALDTFCGSPPYAAPELFRDERYVGAAVDVWAAGVLLFFMVTGTMPFRADTMGKLRRRVTQAAYTLPPWVPAPCQRLIRGILQAAPEERYAVDQMLGCDWLLPVQFPRALHSERRDQEEEEEEEEQEVEEEVRGLMEELGFTAEHLQNNRAEDSRSPVTGVHRVLLHRVQKRRGCDAPPVVRGLVMDPKREGLRAYKGLRHTSKFCVLS